MPAATVNGVNLAYETAGEGPPMVLIHGFSNSRRAWDPVLESLAARRQVFAYDHRGHGDSDKPPGPYSIEMFAEDLLGFLNFVGLDRVDLMGHSMGGRTALMFALAHPERLDRLLLVGASGAAPKGEFRERFDVLRRVAAEEGMAAVFDHEMVVRLLPPVLREPAARARHRKLFMKNTPEGYCGAVDAIVNMPDLTGRLGEIHTPAWVCAGDQDAGPLAFSELCERRMPDCTRAVIPACGHFPMHEAPEAFLASLFHFLERGGEEAA